MGLWDELFGGIGHQANRLGYYVSHGFDGRSDAEKAAGVPGGAIYDAGNTLARTGDYGLKGALAGSALGGLPGAAIGGLLGAAGAGAQSYWEGINSEAQKEATYAPELLNDSGLLLDNTPQERAAILEQAEANNPGSTASAQESELLNYIKQQAEKNGLARAENIAAVKGLVNPFDTASQEFRSGLRAALDDSNQAYGQAAAREAGSFSNMATGLRGAMSQAAEMQHRRDLRNIEDRSYAESARNAANWEQNRQSLLQNAMNNDLGTAQMSDLMTGMRQQSQYAQDYALRKRAIDADISNGNALRDSANMANMINWGTQNAGQMSGILKQLGGFGATQYTTPAPVTPAAPVMPQSKALMPGGTMFPAANRGGIQNQAINQMRGNAPAPSIGYSPIVPSARKLPTQLRKPNW